MLIMFAKAFKLWFLRMIFGLVLLQNEKNKLGIYVYVELRLHSSAKKLANT